ncbi:hypothetical protein C808_03352 [Lachnospiraceae bacterium M18-1]|nr:hypothetical protein C808_03352 [Lachnospiraceae bacterium M18-1]
MSNRNTGIKSNLEVLRYGQYEREYRRSGIGIYEGKDCKRGVVRKKRMGTFVKETSPQLLLSNLVIKVMDIIQDILGYYQQANQTIGSQSGGSEHKRILEAIREQDGELAGNLMKRHIQRSRRDICEYRVK